jgi:hypothetical protein
MFAGSFVGSANDLGNDDAGDLFLLGGGGAAVSAQFDADGPCDSVLGRRWPVPDPGSA